MSDFLDTMIAGSQARVADARRWRPLTAPPGAPAGRLFKALSAPSAVRPDGAPARLGLIAEVKRRSPSKGDIAPALDAVGQARAYEDAGADAISVLTEPSRFGGSLDDLQAVVPAVSLPVLRKDFLVDVYQVWEAAAAGAAAVLLIVAALDDTTLAELLAEAEHCGLDALVEVHDESDLERALAAGATIVGVNNRNLRTLAVDLSTIERLAPRVPAGILLVSESGIARPADAERVAAAGARALLVGETLVRTGLGALPALVRAFKGAETDAEWTP